jgi:RNA polymerase sigma factor FliA
MPGDVDLAELERRRPVAIRIARGFIRKLPSSVLREDIEQAALIGLWDALSGGRDVAHPGFEWYVGCRIRGAILDELRAQDWLPRRTRAKAGTQSLSVAYLEDDRDLVHWTERLAGLGASPEDLLLVQSQAAEALRAPMQPKDRRCVELILFRGFRMIDVARELDCSEPRVSQRFERAINIMRAFLTGRFESPAHKSKTTLSVRDRARIVQARKATYDHDDR